jgi:hypothetical protein
VQARLEANQAKLRSLQEMEDTGGEPDVVGYDKKPVNIFSLTVRHKAPPAAGVFAMTRWRWNQEKNINQKTALLAWQTK